MNRLHHGAQWFVNLKFLFVGLNPSPALHRFDNHHGQPNARWLRDDFLYEDSEERTRTLAIAILSPVLFYTPETYYHSLVNIMNDGNIFFEAWRNFVVELHQEWNGLIIIVRSFFLTFLIPN